MPKLALGARLKLPHALPGQVERVADFLKRPRLVVAKPKALPHDLLLFPIEIADGARQIVKPVLLDDRLVDRDVVGGQRVAQLARARVSPVESNRLAERPDRIRYPLQRHS